MNPLRNFSRKLPTHVLLWLVVWMLCSIAWPLQHVAAANLTEGPTVENISGSNAVIRWSTDVATGTRVRYGTALTNLTQTVQGNVAGKHTATLTNLQPATKYYFEVGTARVALATNSFSTPGAVLAEPEKATNSKSRTNSSSTGRRAPSSRESWGDLRALADHFERHGGDFKAKDADDYARQAWEFLQRARADGLPAKLDEDGVIRIYDPKTRAFAAYNRDGTTKTYFKPNGRDYFDRQPGRAVNLKTLKL